MLFFRHTDKPELLTPKVISYLQPKAKIIVILRNPVAATYSSYKFFSDRNLASPEHFAMCVELSVSTFNACVKDYTIPKCVLDVHSSYNVNIPRRCSFVYRAIRIGHYHILLAEWMKHFPKDNFFIVSTERYSRGIRNVITNIWKFLSLRDQPAITLRGLSQSAAHNTAKISIGEMLPDTQRVLQDFFKNTNIELVKLLNNHDFMWA